VVDDPAMTESHLRLTLASLLCLTLAACGDDGSPSDEAGDTAGTDTGDGDGDPGDGDGDPTGDGDGDGDGLPGPAAGWESDFSEAGATFDCDATEDEVIAAGAASVSVGDTTLYVGAEENNQGDRDAIIARFDGGAQTYCVRHETDGPDVMTHGLTWDGGPTAYTVYTVPAAGSGLEGLGGWLPEYSPGPISGVTALATAVGRVDVETGALDSATFIIGVTPDEKVAEHLPLTSPTVLEDTSVELLGSAADAPIDADAATAMDCGAGPYATHYVFSADLALLVCASGSGCTSQMPCE
jgi:hypothetical protein